MARYTNSVPQLLDENGVPIAGAKKFFFEPGTTTLKTIYSDQDLTVSTNNPQISDANGRYSGNIFLDGIYKEEQQDNSGTATGYDGVTLWTKDPIGDIASGSHSAWISDTIYNIPEIVLGTDDFYYESLTDANQGNDPISSPSNWAKITFVKAGVLDGVSEIKDTNSLRALLITPTTSAVNYPEITNSATGEDPKIEASGTDTDINLELGGKGNGGVELLSPIVDDNQNELLEFVSVASAVNNPQITNAATGTGPTLEAKGNDTDIDFNVDPKGVGHLVVNGNPVYNQVILDAPALVLSDTTITATAQTPVDITAQTTGIAVRAILNVTSSAEIGAGAGTSEILVGEGDQTLVTLVHRATYLDYDAATTNLSTDTNQVTVNLAAGEIFDYKILQGGSAPSVARSVKIYLVGYYV